MTSAASLHNKTNALFAEITWRAMKNLFNTYTLDSNEAICCILVHPQYKTNIYCKDTEKEYPRQFSNNLQYSMHKVYQIRPQQFKGIVQPQIDPESRILYQDRMTA